MEQRSLLAALFVAGSVFATEYTGTKKPGEVGLEEAGLAVVGVGLVLLILLIAGLLLWLAAMALAII